MGQARDEAGNIWETDAQGNAVRLISAADQQQGGVFTLPPDPVEQARLANENTRIDISQQQAGINAAAAERAEREWNATHNPDGSPKTSATPLTAEAIGKLQAQLSGARGLLRRIEEVESRYNSDFKGGGLGAFVEYLPGQMRPENQQFEDAGRSLMGDLAAAYGLTAQQQNTPTELEIRFGPFIPRPGDRDEVIEAKIARLREVAETQMQQAGSQLGVAPPAEQPPNPLTAVRMGGSGGAGAAEFGATTGNTVAIPPELSAEHDALVAQLMQQGGGRIDPDAYVQAMGALTTKYPSFGITPESSAQWARDINAYLDAGGKTVPGGMQLEDRPLSGVEQIRNNLISNPLGAAAAGFADTGGFGGVSALAPDQMAALGDAGGWTGAGLMLGQVGGAVTGGAALGKLGAETVGRVLPAATRNLPSFQRLVNSPFARNVATDATYGGIYGGVTDGDPLTGAALGTVGSAGGQTVGHLAGRAVSGVTSSPTIARLYEQGVIPTVGQIMRGRALDNGGRSLVAGVEDVIANNGAVGTFVNAGRGRALEQANLAGFNIASNGRPVTEIGEAGLSQLDTIKDAAYTNALDGVSMPQTDPNYVQGVANASLRGEAIDAARGRGDFTYIMDNELAPILNTPDISGPQIQDALRLLQGQSRAYSKAAGGAAPDPAAAGVSRALDEVSGALTDLAGNYSPDTLPRLQEANSIYRNFRVLDDAAERGRNEGGTFTGAQLGDSIKANNAQFGQRGFLAQSGSPLHQLQQDMVAVLPNKVPPTGVNAAPMLALGGAAMGAGGMATDNEYLKTAGALGLLAVPYTRAGQRATAAALLARPAQAQMLGRAIRNHAGLLGHAALPALLADY